jgi:uncharacterized protein
LSATAPIGSAERIGELDVLRGFALLGVFIVHFVGASFYMLSVDPAWQEAVRAQPLDRTAMILSDFFFLDKANTLFATLFGMGFWVMMERLKARGAPFQMIYLRRLLILLGIGLINVFLIFPGDVLHMYASLGLLLLLLQSTPKSFKLVVGLGLAIGGYWLGDILAPNAADGGKFFETVQAAAFERGEYWNWVIMTAPAFFVREFVHGAFFGWALYLFGRFLIGAWIMQQGWMERLSELRPTIRRLAWLVLPLGLGIEAVSVLIYEEVLAVPEAVGEWLHLFAVPLLALGYALALILLFHSRRKWIALAFAPVGRMALTAYMLHGAIFTAIYMPFGLGMRGIMGPAISLAFVIALYAVMTIFCHWWLARYRYGPLEYLWRWATYGERPKFALAPA